MLSDATISIRAAQAAPVDPVESPVSNQAGADRKPPPPIALSPLLVPAAEAARLLGISKATFYRLKAAGKLPAPVKLGRILWRVDDLRLFVAFGCCSRIKFEAQKASRRVDH
jgi:excisionase family DNA binding protein